jgi:hypothetical protein
MFRSLLTHVHGWSATNVGHKRDGWLRYVQNYSKNSIPDLKLVLDSLTFSDDLDRYPADYWNILEPSYFLFATPQKYYVFDAVDDVLFCAQFEIQCNARVDHSRDHTAQC